MFGGSLMRAHQPWTQRDVRGSQGWATAASLTPPLPPVTLNIRLLWPKLWSGQDINPQCTGGILLLYCCVCPSMFYVILDIGLINCLLFGYYAQPSMIWRSLWIFYPCLRKFSFKFNNSSIYPFRLRIREPKFWLKRTSLPRVV